MVFKNAIINTANFLVLVLVNDLLLSRSFLHSSNSLTKTQSLHRLCSTSAKQCLIMQYVSEGKYFEIGDTHAIMSILASPPIESLSICVSFEFRYGICPAELCPKAVMTSQNAARLRLIALLSCKPSSLVDASLAFSLPAKSTK
eukprot:m.108801 g.108801  ORF g.108801 m.108801 type:complete len:144 (-) comp13980_c0_seq2:2505-2936(-)